jgi:hypothetical protein
MLLHERSNTMATTYESGSAVLSGYYLDPSSWSVTPVARDGERLPAGRGRWVRVPTAAALALVPVLGAAFLLFLPLVGFAVTLHAIASLVVNAFHRTASELAGTVSPGWVPGEAHFTGKAAEHAGVEEKGPISRGDALEALALEIARRRSSSKA